MSLLPRTTLHSDSEQLQFVTWWIKSKLYSILVYKNEMRGLDKYLRRAGFTVCNFTK
jgi:hypothetical protein